MSRVFEDKWAVRELTPLWIGLTGPSACGKTYSALRIATGIQKIIGGDIFGIDTEARRMLHYADKFQFRHVPFGPPFRSLDYLEAIRHCAKKGGRVIVVDSMSHEHDGSGGYLEFHAAEEQRLAKSRAAKFQAWQKPSEERRQLIQGLLQLPISFVFCFRAKEKLKPGKEKDEDGEDKSVMRELGWMPLGGKDFIYEMLTCCLLPPGSNGVPDWDHTKWSEEQKLWIKKPGQFASLLKNGTQLSEAVGEALARWSNGGAAPSENWEADHQAAVSAAISGSTAETSKPETGPDASDPCPACKTNVPRCKACKMELLFSRSDFNRRDGSVYPAFWRCPQKCKHPTDKRRNTSINARDWHAIVSAQQPPKREPGDDSEAA